MNTGKLYCSLCIYATIFLCFFGCNFETDKASDFHSSWDQNDQVDRAWAGKEYWLNPLQSWRQKDGYVQCMVSGGDRNIVILTRSLGEAMEAFEVSTNFGRIDLGPGHVEDTDGNNDQGLTDGRIKPGLSREGWVGVQLGLKGGFDDYRDDAIKGIGLSVGVTNKGNMFIGDLSNPFSSNIKNLKGGKITINGNPAEDGVYELALKLLDDDGVEQGAISKRIHPSWLNGLLALTCSQSIPDTLDWMLPRPNYGDLKALNKAVGGDTRYAFSDWKVAGKKIISHNERAFGPILWSQHTLSNGILKMSVQMAPVGNGNRDVDLYVDGELHQTAQVDTNGRNVIFRLTEWDHTNEKKYTVRYRDLRGTTHEYSGIIRKEPRGPSTILASMSCIDDRGFPHQDLVQNVADHEPDILVFHGDQLYERVGEYGVERNSFLDYQRKWYVFGWSFGNLLRDIPSIIIPDDHDVFHGNLWGEAGKAANVDLGYGYDSQDSGGYKEPPEFINMVHRTQTGHLPDPVDSQPVLRNISVYFTEMNYAGISFAILGDRQWKSAPKPLLPNAEIENGWPQNQSWNAKTDAFHPEAQLLGDRQERFLAEWVTQWDNEVAFKTVISQSPFCNVATLPAHIYHDKYVPGLPRYKKGEYPRDDRPVADFDSNGWPQNKRNTALEIIRKAYALHITGDQHLGSTGQYGVNEYGDAGFWISSPAVSNLWPRRWFPAAQAQGGKEANDTRRYTGNFEDGFGNKITVKAIANPHDIDREPSFVFDKAPGYSIVRFDRNTRKIELTVWPRWSSPKRPEPDNEPYEGWPIEISQMDNYGREEAGRLMELILDGTQVVEVRNETTKELVSAIKPPPGSYRPKVFDSKASYSIVLYKNGNVEREERGQTVSHSN